MKRFIANIAIAALLFAPSPVLAAAGVSGSPPSKGVSGSGGGVNAGSSFTSGDLIVGGPSTTSIQDSSALASSPGYATLPSGIDLTKNVAFQGSGTGASNPQSADLYFAGTVSGTCNNSGVPCGAFHFISAPFKGVSSGANTAELVHIQANVGTAGGSALGGGAALGVFEFINSAIADTGAGNSYLGINNYSHANVNVGGTGSGASAVGNVFSSAWIAGLDSGATNFAGVHGLEQDIYIATGANANFVGGISVILLPGNAVAGSTENTAFFVGAQTGATATLTCAYCLGSAQAFNALASTASIMKYLPNSGGSTMTVTNGIDLYSGGNVTFTGSPFLATAGSTSHVAYGYGANVATGIYFPATNTVSLCGNSNCPFSVAGAQVNMADANIGGGALSPSSGNASINGSATNGGLYTGQGSSFDVTIEGHTGTAGLQMTSAGLISLPAIATGTPAASLCIDSSNNIIKKTTTGSCI